MRVHTLLLIWRRIKRVKGNFHARVDHICDDFLQERAGRLQARIRVNFDQVNLELLVEHEVEAKYFKRVVLQGARRRNDLVRGSERIGHDLLYLRENVRPEVYLQVAMLLVQVVLVFGKGELVARLKPAVLV